MLKRKKAMPALRALCLTLACLFLTGCIPDGRATVRRALREGLTVKVSLVDSSREKSGFLRSDATYHFRDENGVAFTYVSGFGRGAEGFPYKRNTCDYASRLLDLSRAAAEGAFDASLEWEHAEWNDQYQLYVDDFTQLSAAARAIERALAACPPFPILRDSYPYTIPSVAVHPADSYIEVGEFFFLCEGEDKPAAADILAALEREYADAVKQGRIEETLPEEAMGRHPASSISQVYWQGTELANTFRLTYVPELDDYIMRGLDPCQDFEDFPYNYFDKGAFAWLVGLLGGSYECDDWRAEWRIGGDVWTAKLETAPKDGQQYSFKELLVEKNGQPLALSAYYDSNGTVSGRAFTAGDLEALFGVTATIDQEELTAHFEGVTP